MAYKLKYSKDTYGIRGNLLKEPWFASIGNHGSFGKTKAQAKQRLYRLIEKLRKQSYKQHDITVRKAKETFNIEHSRFTRLLGSIK